MWRSHLEQNEEQGLADAETKQERRERRRKKRRKIPQHGKSLSRVYKDAVLKRTKKGE